MTIQSMSDTARYPDFLVSTEWLARHLDDPRVRVFDPSTLLLPKPDYSMYDAVPARADFETGHIPGAAFVDIGTELSTPHPRLRFMLPDAQAFASAMFAQALQKAGSNNLLRRWNCSDQRGAGAGHAGTQARQSVRRVADRMGGGCRIADGDVGLRHSAGPRR